MFNLFYYHIWLNKKGFNIINIFIKLKNLKTSIKYNFCQILIYI